MDQTNLTDILKLSEINMSGGSSITLALILLNSVLAAAIGVFISVVYRRLFAGVLFQKSFAIAIIAVTIVTNGIVMVISGNLVLSLGMVGALSIVRFRAAIKDPLDVVYLFWAIGSGIAVGVSQYTVAFGLAIVLAVVLSIVTRFQSSAKPSLLVISVSNEHCTSVKDHVSRLAAKLTIRSVHVMTNVSELVFELNSAIDEQSLYRDLKKFDKKIEVRTLNYYGNN